MGLLVLAALLVPQWLGAQTVTSTFVYSEMNYPADQQGLVTTICHTREGNDWSTTNQITLDYDGIAFYGGVTLTSQFPVSGELTKVSMQCNYASSLTADFQVPDANGRYVSLGQMDQRVEENGTVLSLIPVKSIWVDESNVQLVVNPAEDIEYTDSIRIYSISLEFLAPSDGNPVGVTIYLSEEGDSYPVEITEDNMNDVLGDGTISFTPDGNILTLNNASFGGEAGALECSLPNLTIHLIGSSTLTSYEGFIYMWGQEAQPTLTFTTDDDDPGMLTFKDAYDEEMLFSGITPTYLNGLSLQQMGDDYVISKMVEDNSLGVTIFMSEEGDSYPVEITEDNMDDVLGDGSICFDPENNILTLNNASFGGDAGALECSLPALTIHLIGSSTLTSYEGFIYMWGQDAQPTLTFTTDDDNPGMLTFKGANDEEMLFTGITPTYLNGLSLQQMGDDYVIAYIEDYDVWVAGTQVTSLNKDNVLNDSQPTVSYNPSTQTLTLKDAVFSGSIESTEDLTVDLVGGNNIYSNGDLFQARSRTMPTLTFTTSRTSPGYLSWGVASGYQFQSGYEVVYKNGLAQQGDGLVAVEPYAEYDLIIAGTQVNSLNRLNVRNELDSDGRPTVQFDGHHTLALSDAIISGRIVSGIDQLTIHLKGENKLGNSTVMMSPPLTSTAVGASLTFTKSLNDPGSLLLVDQSGTKNLIEGFGEDYTFEYNLRMELTGSTTALVSTFDPLAPIVRENGSGRTPTVFVNMDNSSISGTPLDNVILENILFVGLDYDNTAPAGVVMTTGVDETDVDAALQLTPGSDEFANAFRGMVFRLPAGTGTIMMDYEAKEGSTMKIRIGYEAPYEFTGSGKAEVPYSCLEPTLVFVYLANNVADSRLNGPRRWKGEVGHVKSSSLGVTSSSMVNNNSTVNMQAGVQNMVTVYSLPPSALNGYGIELSVIEMTTQPVAASRARMAQSTTVLKPITALGNDLFDKVEKQKIRYINLSQSELKNFNFSREEGPMKGFGKNTLVYLPDDNDDGGEENVVVNGSCGKLFLDGGLSFMAPYDFQAKKVVLDSTFDLGQTTTLYLPFALTAQQAAEAGSFRIFDRIQGDKAIFRRLSIVDGTEANVPYVFIPDVDAIQLDDIAIKGCSTSATGTFVGTFEQITFDKDQSDIYLLNEGTNMFVQAKSGDVLPSFKAYLKSETSGAELRMVVDDGAVGIDGIHEATADSDTWYTVDGQRLSGHPAKAGLYIHNGEKVLLR
jgi:hypothetical protein